MLAILCFFMGLALPVSSPLIPVTGSGYDQGNEPVTTAPIELTTFIRTVATGNAEVITGLYVAGKFALPVVPQPDGEYGYVSPAPGWVTQFSLALNYGSMGFLAHNYLAGAYFSGLIEGERILVVHGDGHTQAYSISQIRSFQAVDPTSPYSNFIDQDNGATLTYSDLFSQTYGVAGRLILQTCIRSDGNPSWGRLFVIATPVLPNSSALIYPLPGK